MTITAVYPGYDQPDIARVTCFGVTYTCYVWQRPGALAILAAIYVELEDGERTLIDGPVVVTAQTDRAFAVECPKVVGRLDGGDGYFILHALETETDGTGCIIYRWVFDLQGISTGWQSYGPVATTHPAALYDVCEVEGSESDYVLAHKNQSGTEISIGRWYAANSVISSTWLETHSLECENRILGVFATDSIGADGGTVMVTRQMLDSGSTPHELWTFRVDADTGTGGEADVETFGASNVAVTATNEYLQVRHALMSTAGTGSVAIVVEMQTVTDQTAASPDSYARYVAWTAVDRDSVVLADPQNIPGVTLHGAWSYASGVALGRNLYALIGFTTLSDGQEWQQMYGYVVDLDYLATIAATAAGTVEVKPVMAYTDGSFDARISGNHSATSQLNPGTDLAISLGVARRVNHLSHTVRPPQYATGCKLKSVTTAGVAWEQLMPVAGDGADIELHPTQSSIRGYEFHHEDPWLHRRDGSEPAAPSSSNVKTLAPWSIGQATDLGEFLHFSGGVQHVYDGHRLVELGYLWAPQILSTAANGSTSDGSGMTDLGTYYYTLTYAWRDAHGHLHRSAPANPILHTQEADAEGVTIIARTMTISMKDRTIDGGTRPVSVELWRTYYEEGATAESGGTYLFRRVFCTPGTNPATMSIAGTPINDRTEWMISFDDGQSDAAVSVAELLPWQLDPTTLAWNLPTPIPPPACTVAAVWNNRVFVVPSEHPDQLRYTKEIETLGTQQKAPEFNDVNVYRLDNRGPITALQVMDDAMIVFTRDQIMAMTGEGNTAAGGLPDGPELRHTVIAGGIGCMEPRSVVLAPAFGVFFQADRGIYLLTREHGLEYVGADVEDIVRAAGNIRAATLLEDRHQVRFVINGTPSSTDVAPRVLIYDYLVGKWSMFEAPEVGSASTERLNEMQGGCAWRGEAGEVLHVFLQSGGLAVERPSDDTTYADTTHTATAGVAIDITTGWINLAGIAGWKRVTRIGLQFAHPNSSELTVEFFYDRDGTYDEATADQTEVITASTLAYHELRPNVQKFSAIMLRVYESGTVPQTANIRLTGMTFMVGRDKRGIRPVGPSQVQG